MAPRADIPKFARLDEFSNDITRVWLGMLSSAPPMVATNIDRNAPAV